ARYRAVFDDPPSHRYVPVGVGISEHPSRREEQWGINRKPEDQRQRETQTPAVVCRGRDVRHAVLVALRFEDAASLMRGLSVFHGQRGAATIARQVRYPFLKRYESG